MDDGCRHSCSNEWHVHVHVLTAFEPLHNLIKTKQKSSQIKFSSTTIIAPIGLLFNLVFLFTVIRVKSMHTIINIYLSNLAVADSLWLLQDFLYSLFFPTEYNTLLQQTILSFRYLFQTACNFFVVTIAAERLSAVCHPLTFREKASKSRAVKISAGLWLPVIILGVTLIFLPKNAFIFFNFWVYYITVFVCLSVTLVLYIYIVVKIHSSDTRTAQSPNRLNQAGKVIRMIIVNTAIFFTLNSLDTAIAISAIVRDNLTLFTQLVELLKLEEKLNKLTLSSNILWLINSSISPLVYSASNSNYRTAVVQAFSFFKLCCPCYPRQNPSQPSQPWEQIELHVIQNPQNDQQHHAVRLNSSRPTNQGLAQQTQSQQPLHSCQQQCSTSSNSKASMHRQQHILVHVHTQPAKIPTLESSHQEQCSSLTDCKPSLQGEQSVHQEPAESQQSIASTQELSCQYLVRPK